MKVGQQATKIEYLGRKLVNGVLTKVIVYVKQNAMPSFIKMFAEMLFLSPTKIYGGRKMDNGLKLLKKWR